jgi:N-acetylglucosaminyl-diphospho-decaprenol L-rhamnosyltransferase
MRFSGDVETPADVGVVIVHFRREAEVAVLSRSLIVDHGVRPENVVLVDNGSDGELLASQLGSLRDEISVVHLDNVGYGAAVNIGERLLPESVCYVAVLTHEVIVEPGCLSVLASQLAGDPHVGLAGPLLLEPSGLVWSSGGSTRRFRKLSFNSGKGADPKAVRGVRDVDWLDGAAFMIPRGVLRDLGGVEEKFFLYFEDVDLGFRVRRAGLRVVCNPAAVATQAPGGHLNTYLATRNVLWLLAGQGYWLAWLIFLIENVVRLGVGPIFRPQGAAQRARQRGQGIIDGLQPSANKNTRS